MNRAIQVNGDRNSSGNLPIIGIHFSITPLIHRAIIKVDQGIAEVQVTLDLATFEGLPVSSGYLLVTATGSAFEIWAEPSG